MKTNRFAFLLALLGLSAAVASASPAGGMNFSLGGNLPIQAKLTAPGFNNDTVEGNLINSGGYADDGFRTFGLADNGYIQADFAGNRTLVGTSSASFAGSFYLHDNGAFDLSFNADDYGIFSLTLKGLLPEDRSIVNGFNLIDGNTPLFETLNFDFSQADIGIVVVSGNIAPTTSSWASGTFTAASAIPEPATVALGLAAAAGLFAAWRRRKQAV